MVTQSIDSLAHASLFTGVGGFELAAKWAGFETVMMCEIDLYCRALLGLRFPGVSIIGDVRDVKVATYSGCLRQAERQEQTAGIEQCGEAVVAYAESRENHSGKCGVLAETTRGGKGSHASVGISDKPEQLTLLTAGVPCQPASQAGKRRGKEDDRWLWPEAIRVLGELHPAWAVFENPVGIGSLGEFGEVSEMGAGELETMGDWEAAELDNICRDIEAHGYEVQPVSLPACAVGAPHPRQRIFIVCHSRSAGLSGDTWGRTGQELEDGYSEFIAHTKSIQAGSMRSGTQEKQSGLILSDWSTPNAQESGLEGAITEGGECAGGCAAEYDWQRDWTEVAARFCGVDDGLPAELDGLKLTKSKHREERLKALGNAIVPQQVYPILKAIADIEKGLGEGK